jgi:hypothetical protein
MIRGFLDFFWRTIPSSISTHEKKKKKLQKAIISSPDMEVQNFKKKFPNVLVDAIPPSAFLFTKEKQ